MHGIYYVVTAQTTARAYIEHNIYTTLRRVELSAYHTGDVEESGVGMNMKETLVCVCVYVFITLTDRAPTL